MPDAQQPATLETVRNTAAIAANARQTEFNLYNAARAAGNLAGLNAHYQGYQTALGVEQKANEVLVQQIVDSASLQNDLQMLAEANAQLSATAAQLAADSTALNLFTQAAGAVVTVLSAIAVL